MKTRYEEQPVKTDYKNLKYEVIYEIIDCKDPIYIGSIIRGLGRIMNGYYGIVLHSSQDGWKFLNDDTAHIDSMKFQKVEHGKITIEW